MKSVLIAAIALLASGTAGADTFNLNYTTTSSDAIHPPITTSAVITAEPDAYTDGQWDITSIMGNRNGVAITGFDSFYNVFYYPAAQPDGYSFKTFLDDTFAEITFTAGGTTYNLYRGLGDTSFYHEYEGPDGSGTGRLIDASAFSITAATSTPAVPELATWAMMIAGVATTGYALRRRRASMALALA